MFETHTHSHNLSVYHAVVCIQMTKRILKYEDTSSIALQLPDKATNLGRETVRFILYFKTLILIVLGRRPKIANYPSHDPNSSECLFSAMFKQ
jgi:ADP-ribosylglycohydrolase